MEYNGGVLAGIRIRIFGFCCLTGFALICPAHDKPAAPAQDAAEPAELGLEQRAAPDALISLVNMRRWDEVLKVALLRLSETPDDPTLHYWAGVACFHQRNFIEAVRSLRSAEKMGLDGASLHEALGVAYYTIHQQLLFLQQMDAALKADAADPLPYHYLGRYYEHDINDYQKAISYFDKALERDPGDFKSMHFRAFCLQMLGRNGEARTGYEAAIRRIEDAGEHFGWPYQKLAESLLLTNPSAAVQYAQKAVELEPGVESNHLVLAKAYESLGNLDGAIQECLQASRVKPNEASIRYSLFRLYKKKGDGAAAAEQLKLHEKLRATYVSQQ